MRVTAAMIRETQAAAEQLPARPLLPAMKNHDWKLAVKEAGVSIADADLGLVYLLAVEIEAAGNLRPFECIREAVRKLNGLTRLERDLLENAEAA
jgi:hypothetical protein